MKKQLSIVFLVLVASGIVITLNAPPEENPYESNYKIDQDSMDNPLPDESTLLTVSASANELYGLQLGLFSELRQATQQIEDLKLHSLVQIITTQNMEQRWYRVIAGPFSTTAEASKMQKQLDAEYLVKSSWIKWPLAINDKGA